jgi:hypothetical protein
MMNDKTMNIMKMMHNKIRRLFNNRLMIVISLSFIICHLSFNILNAQTYTQRLQKNTDGKAKVTIHHSKAIDDLVNGPKVNIQTVATKNVETATTMKTTAAIQRKQDVVAKDKVWYGDKILQDADAASFEIIEAPQGPNRVISFDARDKSWHYLQGKKVCRTKNVKH